MLAVHNHQRYRETAMGRITISLFSIFAALNITFRSSFRTSADTALAIKLSLLLVDRICSGLVLSGCLLNWTSGMISRISCFRYGLYRGLSGTGSSFSSSSSMYIWWTSFIFITTSLLLSFNSVSTMSSSWWSDNSWQKLTVADCGCLDWSLSRLALTKHGKCYFMSSTTDCSGSDEHATLLNLTRRPSLVVSSPMVLIWVPIFLDDTSWRLLPVSSWQNTHLCFW